MGSIVDALMVEFAVSKRSCLNPCKKCIQENEYFVYYKRVQSLGWVKGPQDHLFSSILTVHVDTNIRFSQMGANIPSITF